MQIETPVTYHSACSLSLAGASCVRARARTILTSRLLAGNARSGSRTRVRQRLVPENAGKCHVRLGHGDQSSKPENTQYQDMDPLGFEARDAMPLQHAPSPGCASKVDPLRRPTATDPLYWPSNTQLPKHLWSSGYDVSLTR